MKIAVVLLYVMALAACGGASHDPSSSGSLGNPVLGVVTFADVNALIFTPKCVGCHASFATYDGVVNRIGAIQDAIESDRMPLRGPPVTPELKTLLAEWVAQGAPVE